MFAVRSGEFVGHVISEDGRLPVSRTVEKIADAPRARNKHELQRFLGLVNFYWEYIQNMAQVAEPLYRLTHKGTEWMWGSPA